MAILDAQLVFSDAQAITGDARSTNYYNKGAAGALGKPLWLVCRVDTTFDSSGEAATLQIQLRTDDNTSFSSPTVLAMSAVIAEADLVENTEVWKIQLPPGLQKYFEVYYDRGVEDFTAGKIDAYLTPDPEVRP